VDLRILECHDLAALPEGQIVLVGRLGRIQEDRLGFGRLNLAGFKILGRR
jgi:hypothetical protein